MVHLIGHVDAAQPVPTSFTSVRALVGGTWPRVWASLETVRAEDIVAWAIASYGDGLVLTASFQDCVLIDMATRIDPAIDVVFLDTQFHFPETIAYVDEICRHYELRLRVVRPKATTQEWPCGSDECCQVRKTEPLNRALTGKSAWMTGLRRVQTPERSHAPVVSVDEGRGLVKINPLATWTDDQVEHYVVENGLPVHPLKVHGYASIGCAPTTLPVRPGQPSRTGRWPGSEKTECGIHL